MSSDEQVIIFAGIGGQGIQVAGKTLAHAAVYERKRALYYSLFDGGQRGGVSDCIVAVSSDRLEAPPLIKQPCAALFAMDPNGLVRYQAMVRPGGLIVFNQSIHEVSRFRYADMSNEKTVDEARPTREDIDVLGIDATNLATERLEAPLMASLICLGALIARTGAVSLENAQRALYDAIRPGRHAFVPRSAAALTLGADVALGREVAAAV
jgi:2-oxoglutarate ferredoxin oxidoreductase subunit gamma